MATSPPPPPVAAPRTLETGTKLHVSNLNASVTVEDVQVLAVLLLLLLLLLRSSPQDTTPFRSKLIEVRAML
jgi:hypothetical protein